MSAVTTTRTPDLVAAYVKHMMGTARGEDFYASEVALFEAIAIELKNRGVID